MPASCLNQRKAHNVAAVAFHERDERSVVFDRADFRASLAYSRRIFDGVAGGGSGVVRTFALLMAPRARFAGAALRRTGGHTAGLRLRRISTAVLLGLD